MRRVDAFRLIWSLPVLILAAGTLAGDAVADPPQNTTTAGVAVRGYDVVAYFEQGEARRGSKDHEVEWGGARWRFATAGHAAAFEADPERYAPQYGGYCAWAMADGREATIDPRAWDIVDGRLYLNYSKAIQGQWREDVPGFIERADRHWSERSDEGGGGAAE